MTKLQSIPWYLRLIVFVVVSGVAYAGFWYFITKGTRADTHEMNAEIAQLLPKNAQAQIASQRLNEFRARDNDGASGRAGSRSRHRPGPGEIPSQRRYPAGKLQWQEDRSNGHQLLCF